MDPHTFFLSSPTPQGVPSLRMNSLRDSKKLRVTLLSLRRSEDWSRFLFSSYQRSMQSLPEVSVTIGISEF